MSKKIYVGNLGFTASESDLLQLFSPHGVVVSARIALDRKTNQSKGFGFVEMATDVEAIAAIAALNGQDHSGRSLKVDEAKTKATSVATSAAERSEPVFAPW